MATSRRPPRAASRVSPARKSPRPAKRPGRAGKAARADAKAAAKAAPKAAPKAASKLPRSAALIALEKLALGALTDMKGVNIKVLDVRGLTDVADTMIVCSGTSDRHVRSLAELVIERAKAAGRRPMGTEGKQDAEWVLVDLQDVLVHVMLPRVREFYALEQLWEAPAAARRASPPDQRPQSP
jgi:ribosome-associated protein